MGTHRCERFATDRDATRYYLVVTPGKGSWYWDRKIRSEMRKNYVENIKNPCVYDRMLSPPISSSLWVLIVFFIGGGLPSLIHIVFS